jgi:uncharacterized protein (TIGR02145 family)
MEVASVLPKDLLARAIGHMQYFFQFPLTIQRFIMKTNSFLLATSIMLATALTFSCSLDDDNNDGNSSSGGSASSSSSVGGSAVFSSSSQPSSSSKVIAVVYGDPVTDVDGQTYETVIIGNQTWMAKNLNRNVDGGSQCYDNDPANCEIYGRLYDWETAMMACPSGWSLPSDDEWKILENYVGRSAGEHLKAKSGWYYLGSGKDTYGFAALPGGFGGSIFYSARQEGYWWSSTEFDSLKVYYRRMSYDYEHVFRDYGVKRDSQKSVRCVKDSN